MTRARAEVIVKAVVSKTMLISLNAPWSDVEALWIDSIAAALREVELESAIAAYTDIQEFCVKLAQSTSTWPGPAWATGIALECKERIRKLTEQTQAVEEGR